MFQVSAPSKRNSSNKGHVRACADSVGKSQCALYRCHRDICLWMDVRYLEPACGEGLIKGYIEAPLFC